MNMNDTVSAFKPLIRPWYHDPSWKVAPIFRRFNKEAASTELVYFFLFSILKFRWN